MINTEWKFYKGRMDNAFAKAFDDASWATVNIPHTWNNIDGQNGTVGGKDINDTDYFRGDGWYRKKIFLDTDECDKIIHLRFQGANMQTEIFVNGIFVGNHKGGYTAFSFNITPQLKFGSENLIAIKINNERTDEIAPITADFTFYGGIYRELELIKKEKLHFSFGEHATRGIKISTPVVNEEKAICEISAVVENNTNADKDLNILAKIGADNIPAENPYINKTDFDNSISKRTEFSAELCSKITVAANTHKAVQFTFEIDNPHLWNGRKDPYLYGVSLEIEQDGRIVDTVVDSVGLRYFNIDKNEGFFLNGKSYPLRGVSRHQDREKLGNAITNNEHNEDFAIIYDMGVNALRLAHYPQAEYFYRLCDYYGIVVWAEIPVVDLIGGSGTFNNPDNLRKEFFNTTKQQLREMINQNYNHPSIICWGIQNEIQNKFDDVMRPFTEELHSISKSEDKYRYTTMATNHRGAFNWKSDLMAWNVYPGWYGMSRKQLGYFMDRNRCNRPTGISEYGAGGNYLQHEIKPKKPKHNGQWHPEEYQTISHEAFLKSINERSYLWCTFVWNMFDFGSDGRNEGNRPGMNDKGLVSFDRKVKKDSYFLYQSNWSENPMVHITGKRLTERRKRTEIKIYSNCEAVTLYVNDVKIKTIEASCNRQKGIFIFKSVKLIRTKNAIKAIAKCDGKEYCDSTEFLCK